MHKLSVWIAHRWNRWPQQVLLAYGVIGICLLATAVLLSWELAILTTMVMWIGEVANIWVQQSARGLPRWVTRSTVAIVLLVVYPVLLEACLPVHEQEWGTIFLVILAGPYLMTRAHCRQLASGPQATAVLGIGPQASTDEIQAALRAKLEESERQRQAVLKAYEQMMGIRLAAGRSE